MTGDQLSALLERTLASDAAHVEKLTIVTAVISEVLRAQGMEATLVGGGAIEYHAAGTYATSDIDLVVEGGSRSEIDRVLTDLGFHRRGRHWAKGDVLVEVPGNWMSDPVDTINVDGLTIRVVRKEIVLADRIIGFKHWGATAYGAEALPLLALWSASIDESLLVARLRAEGAEDALVGLRALVSSGKKADDEALRDLLARLAKRPSPEDQQE